MVRLYKECTILKVGYNRLFLMAYYENDKPDFKGIRLRTEYH